MEVERQSLKNQMEVGVVEVLEVVAVVVVLNWREWHI